jgi:hypothetical protein
MDQSFAHELSEWTAYYALAGGAAATLLGLLFVAVSLRLDIFRRREVADVRDFAAFTLATFLVAIAVAGLALAPHASQGFLTWALLIIGLGGLAVFVAIVGIWIRLNPGPAGSQPGYSPAAWQGWAYLLVASGPYVGMLVAAWLLWRRHADALGGLALVEAYLLAVGTISAWIMLSHAGASQDDESTGR